jgi:hypothetical protein
MPVPTSKPIPRPSGGILFLNETETISSEARSLRDRVRTPGARNCIEMDALLDEAAGLDVIVTDSVVKRWRSTTSSGARRYNVRRAARPINTA